MSFDSEIVELKVPRTDWIVRTDMIYTIILSATDSYIVEEENFAFWGNDEKIFIPQNILKENNIITLSFRSLVLSPDQDIPENLRLYYNYKDSWLSGRSVTWELN
jgi:hypothetical protein